MKLILLLPVLLFFTSNIFAQNLPKVFYEVSPVLQKTEAKLKVKLSFKGNKNGVTEIKLPLQFAVNNSFLS